MAEEAEGQTVAAPIKLNPGHWPGMKVALIYAAIGRVTLHGDWAEFGVWKGDSARFLLKMIPHQAKLHLYDSWEGLPEDWVGGYPKGSFKLDSPPEFDDPRVVIHKGLFSDTLCGDKPLYPFVHVDCDLRSSAKTVLDGIQLVSGVVLVFDEFQLGEEAALKETGVPYEELFDSGYGQVAVVIR